MLIVYLVLILGIILGIILTNNTYIFQGFGVCLVIIFFVVILVLFIIHPIVYYTYKAEIKRYEVLKQMYNNSKKEDLRDATIIRDIIEYNMDLASVKYWNNIYALKDFIPDKLAELDFIK